MTSQPKRRRPDQSRDAAVVAGLRLGCGAVAGVAFGLWAAFQFLPRGWLALVLIGFAALACGLLALKYGDRFWEQFVRLWW